MSLRMKLRDTAPQDTTIGANSGNSRKSYFKQTGSVKLEFLKFENPGTYQFNILPWMGADGKAKDILQVWVHRNIGPSKSDYLCPGHQSCPICAEVDKLWDTDENAARAIKASERALMLVQPIGRNGPEGAPKIFETAARGQSSFITYLASAQEVSVDKTWVADPDNGPTIQVLAQKETFHGRAFMGMKRVDLVPRQYEVSDAVLESCPCISDWLIQSSSKQLEDAMYGVESEQAEGSVETEENVQPRNVTDSTGRTFEDPYPSAPTAMQTSAQQAPVETPVQTSSDGCPKGYQFGVDFDNKPLCARCPDAIYEKCSKCHRSR